MPSVPTAEKARQIISSNNYLTLATSDSSGRPWAAPLYYAYDDVFTFYFVSAADSLHARHIAENEHAAWTIFDSHVLVGEGDGVQIKGLARQLSVAELPHATRIYFKRRFSHEMSRVRHRRLLSDFMNATHLRFFRLRPVDVFTLDLSIKNVVTRVRVDLM